MRRLIAAAVGLFVLGGVGCSSFTYTQKDTAGGVVEFKASEQAGVIAKLKQEQGEIEVVAVGPKGQAGGLFDPANPNRPVGPSERMASTSGFGGLMPTAGSGEVMQMTYRKKATAGGTPAGLPPVQDDVMPAGYQQKTTYPTKTDPTGSLPKPNMTGIN